MNLKRREDGFTLIELMIAMTISTVVAAVIYSAYQAQLQSHITQERVVEMQQNARAAMYAMEREIKMAGYDPDRSQNAQITVADNNTITFTISAISDGIDNDADGNIDGADLNGGEVQTITYAIVGQDLQRNGAVLAENIEVLNFVYLDENRNFLGPTPLDANNRDKVRSVQITLIARSGDNVPALMMKYTDNHTYNNQQGDALLVNPNDNFRRMVLTADIKCRNLGLN